MLSSVLLAVAVAVTPADIKFVPNASAHTVMFFDNEIQVTQRVLADTMKADVIRAQNCFGTGSDAYTIMQNALCRNRVQHHNAALAEHCISRLRYDGLNILSCGEGTRGINR